MRKLYFMPLLAFAVFSSAVFASDVRLWNDYYNYFYARNSCGTYNWSSVYSSTTTGMNYNFSVWRVGVDTTYERKQAGNSPFGYTVYGSNSVMGRTPSANLSRWDLPKYISNRGGNQDWRITSSHYKHYYWNTTKVPLVTLAAHCNYPYY